MYGFGLLHRASTLADFEIALRSKLNEVNSDHIELWLGYKLLMYNESSRAQFWRVNHISTPPYKLKTRAK